jgi:potassium-transporting ATPase potassium-binding subunit
MLAGRYGVAIPTSSPLFVVLLLSVVVIVGALTFLPADLLGPALERVLLLHGSLF